ncbi:MAG: hypothetical protein ACYSYL_18550, partial [Planctomycetota bacterium]
MEKQRMGERAIIVLIAGILFVPLSVFAEKQSQNFIQLHHFQLPCGNCHIPGSTESEDQLQKSNNAWQVSSDINRQCTTLGCHDFDPMLNHPVGIRPQGTVPVDMPLDSDLQITCLTCHDKTSSSYDSNDTDGEWDRLLSIPKGIKFCSSCHTKMGGNFVKQSHWQFSTRAHLISKKTRIVESAHFEQFFGDIDPESLSCLSCHDNITVTIPPMNETSKQRKRRWQRMSDHPIGMEYRDVALRRVGGYKFPLFGERIRLFKGKLGCGSCHSLYAQTKDHLVERNERG